MLVLIEKKTTCDFHAQYIEPLSTDLLFREYAAIHLLPNVWVFCCGCGLLVKLPTDIIQFAWVLVFFEIDGNIAFICSTEGKRLTFLSFVCVLQLPQHTITILLGLVFCIMNPIIAPMCLVYFLIVTGTEKYNLLYVYSFEYQSGGQVSRSSFQPLPLCLSSSCLTALPSLGRRVDKCVVYRA